LRQNLRRRGDQTRHDQLHGLAPQAAVGSSSYRNAFGFGTLRDYIKSRINYGSSYLFVSQKGSAMLPTTATALFVKYCQLASEERVRNGKAPIARSCWNFKILKHSRGTHMVMGNANPYLIKQQLGHMHFSSTQVYLHGSQKQANPAAAQVSMEVFS
jgi:site-specific recombinase XerD